MTGAADPQAMRGWRAALLRFVDDRLERIDDGLLVARGGRILEAGEHPELAGRHPDVAIEDWRGLVLAPGFVDVHLHASQIDVMGAWSEGLLDWLDRRTFPAEARLADPAVARMSAEFFVDELLSNGVTAALAFGSPHPASVDALFEAASGRRMRVVAGHALMDRNAPGSLRSTTSEALDACAAMLARWHGVGRLGVALTPRFAPSCSPELLAGVAALHAAHPDAWLQTHAAESIDETSWVSRLFPAARSYVDVYDRFGLLGPRSVLAHCLQVDDLDRARLRDTGTAVAVCPTSNTFLGSGLFDFAAAERLGVRWAFGSDIGAGMSLSPFRTMLAGFEVARLRGLSLPPQALWRGHTLGAAQALGLATEIGNLAPGLAADFVAIDPQATPLLAHRTGMAGSLDDWLFALIALGDDRAIRHTVVSGAPVDLSRRSSRSRR